MFAVTCGNNISFFGTNDLAEKFMSEMITLFRKTAKSLHTSGTKQKGFTLFEIPESINFMNYKDISALILIDLVYVVLEVDDENEKIVGVYANESDIKKYKNCNNYEIETYIQQHDNAVVF